MRLQISCSRISKQSMQTLCTKFLFVLENLHTSKTFRIAKQGIGVVDVLRDEETLVVSLELLDPIPRDFVLAFRNAW
jgi:hypothetical protein